MYLSLLLGITNGLKAFFYGVFCSPLPYPTRLLELGSFQNDSALELEIQPDQARTVVKHSKLLHCQPQGV